MIAEDGIGELDHDNFFSIFQDTLHAFQAKLRASGQSDLFHGAKVSFCYVYVRLPINLDCR
jgi:hypothetical protein